MCFHLPWYAGQMARGDAVLVSRAAGRVVVRGRGGILKLVI